MDLDLPFGAGYAFMHSYELGIMGINHLCGMILWQIMKRQAATLLLKVNKNHLLPQFPSFLWDLRGYSQYLGDKFLDRENIIQPVEAFRRCGEHDKWLHNWRQQKNNILISRLMWGKSSPNKWPNYSGGWNMIILTQKYMLRGTAIALNLQFAKNHRFTFSGESLNIFFSKKMSQGSVCESEPSAFFIFLQQKHVSGTTPFWKILCFFGGIEKPTENPWKTNGKPMFIPQNLSGPPGTPVLGFWCFHKTWKRRTKSRTCWMVFFSTKKSYVFGLSSCVGSCLVGL